MINLEDILLRIVAELKVSDFNKAVEMAGLTPTEVEFVINAIEERGI